MTSQTKKFSVFDYNQVETYTTVTSGTKGFVGSLCDDVITIIAHDRGISVKQ